MIIGYARTSTKHQIYGLQDQIEQLQNYGCEKIFSEQVSSYYDRPQFNKAYDMLRTGDTFVVTKLDRLARSMRHFEHIFNDLQNKNVKLVILNLGFDFYSPTGKLLLQNMMAIAEFERNNMKERQKIGIERAKQDGKMIGRAFPKHKQNLIDNAIKNYNPDICSIAQLARNLGVSKQTIYNNLKKYPSIITARARKIQIINQKFNGDKTAYKLFLTLKKLSNTSIKTIKENFIDKEC